jgi:hypothetical protein
MVGRIFLKYQSDITSYWTTGSGINPTTTTLALFSKHAYCDTFRVVIFLQRLYKL